MTNNRGLTIDDQTAAPVAKPPPGACVHCEELRPVMVQMIGNWFLCSRCWIEGRQAWKLGRVRVVSTSA
jgi:hypothetical protein